ncbi:hypothetical protein, variant 1 [Aphanomyces astaci]|uniref:Uncharacterized protein n=1 Tax=Aphanomyces astaci TaxID=112090 RepID=W4GU90_APHAT|nr:hypothetical protein, variant 1 [Aphanomyces astaci]ETV82478.1 hypothetical protein, variant 1 [Aphanomyces astaci]|eukprot:XP_009828147.1 hypothetical protein, variant 1 [Aphanomyces astaci]
MTRDSTEATSEEERVRKRVYFRERKRILRIKQIADRQDLEGTIMELTERLQMLQLRSRALRTPPTPLSYLQWKDVAAAIQEGRNESIADHRKLNQLVFVSKSTIESMKRWVESSFAPVAASLDPHRESWRHSTLLAPAETRNLGKEWIVLQLYHNTAAMLAKFDFPPHPTDLHDATFEFEAEQHVQYQRRWQTGFPQDMATMLRVFRDHFPSICLLDELYPVSTSQTIREPNTWTQLHQLETHHHHRQEWIQQDDSITLPINHPQRNMLYWLELIPDGGGGCRMRSLFVMSHRLNNDRSFVSFDEEARDGWGCDLQGVPVGQREAVFRRHGAARAKVLQAELERRLQNHIHAVVAAAIRET